MSDLNIEINAQMRRYDDKTLKNVMAIVSQERDNAEKRQQENTGDGFEHYTIVACKDLAAIHKTVLKERENTPEK